MDDKEIRVACLRLASQLNLADAEKLVDAADKLYQFAVLRPKVISIGMVAGEALAFQGRTKNQITKAAR